MRSPLDAKIALVGGVLASIGASPCCVGPLLLLTLGSKDRGWAMPLVGFGVFRAKLTAVLFLF
jgi:hypothetical protein